MGEGGDKTLSAEVITHLNSMIGIAKQIAKYIENSKYSVRKACLQCYSRVRVGLDVDV